MYKCVINRTGRTEHLVSLHNGTKFSGEVAEQYGYKHLSSLDIKDFNKIEWESIEFNRLYVKDGVLYRFNKWTGDYPYNGIEIEEIGTAEDDAADEAVVVCPNCGTAIKGHEWGFDEDECEPICPVCGNVIDLPEGR